MPGGVHTFVVPAFGDSPYLAECIASLQSQTRRSPILICTSTPSEFIELTAARAGVPLRINPVRSGMADDWTFAYRCAETPIVTLAHQDDVYLPDYAASLLGALERVSDANLAFCDCAELIGGATRAHRVHLWIKRAMLRGLFGFSTAQRSALRKRLGLSFGCPITCPTVTFHKARIGDFSFDPRLRFVPDWDAWLRLARRDGAFVCLRRRLVLHRLHPQSETSRLTSGPQRAAEELVMLDKLWPGPIARLIALLYRLGHRANRVARSS